MTRAEDLDLYGLLEVDKSATDDEIKSAYRRKARELHPDANGGDPDSEARFKECSFAYEILSDPERRAQYDRFGPQGAFGGAGGSPFDFEGGLGDLFDAFFSTMGGRPGSARRRGPAPGADAEVPVQLAFAEAAFGVRKELSVRLPVRCETCGGNGAATGTEPVPCPDCQGTGEIHRIRQSLLGQVVTSVACGRCQGLGETIPTPCTDCRGEGRRMEERTFAVDVPAGVEDGSTLRLAERGPAGPRGGANGSLFVHLSVTPDPRFDRAGDDLHSTVHVSMVQATLGTNVTIETLEEPRVLPVVPGSQSGHTERLRGAGIPHLRGRGRGDLFVHLVVDVPTKLTPREEELLRELAAERGEDVMTASSRDGVFSRLRSALG
jgi:molecular chaperone DnaJ